jgi:hypothetical protein
VVPHVDRYRHPRFNWSHHHETVGADTSQWKVSTKLITGNRTVTVAGQRAIIGTSTSETTEENEGALPQGPFGEIL